MPSSKVVRVLKICSALIAVGMPYTYIYFFFPTSDIVTADGTHSERSMISSHNNTPIESSYEFPVSLPTPLDWKRWEAFWTKVSGPRPSSSTYVPLLRMLDKCFSLSPPSGAGIMTKVVISYIVRLIPLPFSYTISVGLAGHVHNAHMFAPTSRKVNKYHLGCLHRLMLTEDLVQRLYTGTGPALSPPAASPPRLLVLSC